MGKIIRNKVSAFVAPSAREPWRNDVGIRASPSSVDTITTGTVRMANVNDDQKYPVYQRLVQVATQDKKDYR